METLNSLTKSERAETMRVALDQMHHSLCFYFQVMGNEPELGDGMRQRPYYYDELRKAKTGGSFLDQFARADELMFLHHLVDAQRHKPN